MKHDEDIQNKLKQQAEAQWQGQSEGIAGTHPDDFATPNLTQADPRSELMHRIDRRIDELLGQVIALRHARQIVTYASYDTINALKSLEIGGIR